MRKGGVTLAAVLAVAAVTVSIVGVGPAPARIGSRQAKSTTVTATEIEWQIKLSTARVHAGKITFVVKDTGKLAHQFIVLRTSRPGKKLPLKGTQVNLALAGKVMGKVLSLTPGKSAKETVTLAAGPYVLLCNLPAHYMSGQWAAFRVT
jgi:uncharacterized cupredoxin-like copper-binding protein